MNNLRSYLRSVENLIDRFTAVRLVGLDLGSAAIKMVELEISGKRIVLKRAFLQNVLSEKENLAAKLSCREVAIGVSSPEVTAQSFSFPSMPKKEFQQAIRLEAEQAILNGHTFDEMRTDWHLFSESAQGKLRGLLAVVPKSVIASRLKTVKEAGFEPVVVDVEGLALWNAFWTLIGSRRTQAVAQTVLLINLGNSKTTLVIAKTPGELLLTRDLEIGAKAMAEGRKKDWVEEIGDSLVYARSKTRMRSLDSIYVTGGGSTDPEIPALLKSAIPAPVTLWNPLDQLEWDSKNLTLEPSRGPLLTLAIGLALRRLS